MKTRSNAYWDKRSMERMAEYHRSANSTVNTITSAYDKSLKDIEREIEKIFKTFGTNGNMDPATARKVLNQHIPNPLLGIAKMIYPRVKDRKIKRWLLNRMNAPAYRARITRLEALKEQIYLQSKVIADVEISASTNSYINSINEAYYRTMFDVQKGLGVGFEFASMPNSRVETILKNPWSGEQFSNRIWNNTEVLAQQITEVITAGFKSGLGIEKMRNDLMQRMNVGKYAANRLIRTETTYMANAAEMESYEEAEIDEYMFMATLDLKTSPQCQEQDGKVYKTKDARPGVNMPPMHVFCRSTTRAYFGLGTQKNIQRRARNPITGKNELVPADMNYKEWRKNIENKHGRNRVDILEKQIRNKSADKEQYYRYKEILGKDAPKSFAAFQDLKYSKLDEWSLSKLDSRRREKLIKNPELKLPNAGKVTAADSKFKGYLFNPNNPTGFAKGNAFAQRLGYNIDNWKQLQNEIVERSNIYPSTLKLSDKHGDRYEQKMILYGLTGKPTNVVVGWNVTKDGTKMTTAYIKEVKLGGDN